ncbi:RNA polymerase-associated protein LEO1-like [Diprion similis]|uniref:RNA polymerase-associated protein LEO1-like n=1 Tax=Diprion similis TaxID=362088 RepID=UPI001EF79A74|nr:RNA polymerase-associated protein LEO1-like [Diprion similis]
MRTTYPFILVQAVALFFTETKSDPVFSVNIIKRLVQDLQTSPSGYSFSHHSDSHHPGGYKANVKHGTTKMSRRIGIRSATNMKSAGPSSLGGSVNHDMTRSYQLAGSYGFVISHGFNVGENDDATPVSDAHYGASNADPVSIAVLQLNKEDSNEPNVNPNVKAQRIGVDSEEETYGSYSDYDKLFDHDKNSPSVNPQQYYGSDLQDERKEKYAMQDGYGESNNGGNEGTNVETEKYIRTEDSSDKGRGDQIDDGKGEKYFDMVYGGFSYSNPSKRIESYEEYGDNESHEKYSEPLEKESQLVTDDKSNYDKLYPSIDWSQYNIDPKFEFADDFLADDFFKEYNEFFYGSRGKSGHDHDFHFEHEDHGDHGFEDDSGHHFEGGHSAQDFFDHSDFGGDYYETGAGEKNNNFGEKSGSKKSIKETGYHNVLHKDEFNKDHTFYSNADQDGHFDKEKDYHGHHSLHGKNHENAGYQDSRSHDDHHGKGYDTDKGHYDNDDISHHDEDDHTSFFGDKSEYNDAGDDEYDIEHEDSHEY